MQEMLVVEKPTLLHFSADWCQPCRLMLPVLHQLNELAGDKIKITRIDVGKNPDFTERYKVSAVPTLLIVSEGKVIWRKNGFSSLHEIVEQLKLALLV